MEHSISVEAIFLKMEPGKGVFAVFFKMNTWGSESNLAVITGKQLFADIPLKSLDGTGKTGG